jgi:hypothetical protein
VAAPGRGDAAKEPGLAGAFYGGCELLGAANLASWAEHFREVLAAKVVQQAALSRTCRDKTCICAVWLLCYLYADACLRIILKVKNLATMRYGTIVSTLPLTTTRETLANIGIVKEPALES